MVQVSKSRNNKRRGYKRLLENYVYGSQINFRMELETGNEKFIQAANLQTGTLTTKTSNLLNGNSVLI